jgi:hypothetical protein
VADDLIKEEADEKKRENEEGLKGAEDIQDKIKAFIASGKGKQHE